MPLLLLVLLLPAGGDSPYLLLMYPPNENASHPPYSRGEPSSWLLLETGVEVLCFFCPGRAGSTVRIVLASAALLLGFVRSFRCLLLRVKGMQGTEKKYYLCFSLGEGSLHDLPAAVTLKFGHVCCSVPVVFCSCFLVCLLTNIYT